MFDYLVCLFSCTTTPIRVLSVSDTKNRDLNFPFISSNSTIDAEWALTLIWRNFHLLLLTLNVKAKSSISQSSLSSNSLIRFAQFPLLTLDILTV